MKKMILLLISLMTIFVLTACDGIDLSQLSDEDLNRLADTAIVCNSPYMRFEAGCCLDKDNNSICDSDENSGNAVSTKFDDNEYYDEFHNELDDNSDGEEVIFQAREMIKDAEYYLSETQKAIIHSNNDEAEKYYAKAKDYFYSALAAYDVNEFEKALKHAKETIEYAEKSKEKAQEYNEKEDMFPDEFQEKIEDAQEEFEELDSELNEIGNTLANPEKVTRYLEEAGNWISLAWDALESGDFDIIPVKLEKAYNNLEMVKDLMEDTYEAEDEDYDSDDVAKDNLCEDETIKLEFATTTEGIVLEWNNYECDDFEGYKVVRSYDVENPKYPEDGYVSFITEQKTGRYVDEKTHTADAHYGITVLTKHGKIYSNSITIEYIEPVDESEIVLNETINSTI